jgi:ArsR family transcriptional regulator
MGAVELLGPLKALADETRLKLLSLLLNHDLCVGALAHRLGISEAAVSQHLQVLRKAGLIKGEKRGYWTHYAVERNLLKELADRLNAIAVQPSCAEGCCRRKLSDEVICCSKEVKKDV